MASLCDMQRAAAKDRIAELNLQAVLQTHALHDTWQSRETYRLMVEAKSGNSGERINPPSQSTY